MAKTSLAHRRKVRELEAKKDRLMEQSEKARLELTKTRAEIRSIKKTGAK